MGSLAGGEQSARQPPVRLQLAKRPAPPSLPEEDPEDEPEEDPDEPDEPDEPEDPEELDVEPDDDPDELEEPDEDPDAPDEPDDPWEPDEDPELDPLPALPSGRSLPAALAHAPSAATATTSSAPPRCPRSIMPASMDNSLSRKRARERGARARSGRLFLRGIPGRVVTSIGTKEHRHVRVRRHRD